MSRTAMAALLVSALALAAGAAAQPASDARIKDIVGQICIGCHGIDGNGATPINPEHPKIAGMQREYIVKQMRDFKKGIRKNAIMEQFAAIISEAEIDGLATYFATQKVKPNPTKPSYKTDVGKRVYLEGNVAAGVPSCSGCHLEDGSGTARFPRVAGQHAEYTYLQLRTFKSGDRDNDRGLVMQSITIKMTDEEMRAVSEHIAGMGSS